MDFLRIDIFEFWYIFLYKFTLRVEFFRLEKRIKYPYRLRVSSDRGAPLPVAIVHRFIVVDEVFFEPFFSDPPINTQIFREK